MSSVLTIRRIRLYASVKFARMKIKQQKTTKALSVMAGFCFGFRFCWRFIAWFLILVSNSPLRPLYT